ncbi:MAG: hypothetical protein ABI273_06120 [Lacunisphaera sp.]
MRALRLLFTAFLAFFAILVAITVFLGRMVGRSMRNGRPVRPVDQRGGTPVPGDDVIDVETTVVSADQGER